MTTEDGPLASFTAELDSAVILTDFDGTLSEIVVDPGAAVPLDGAVAAVEGLSRVAHTVAVVSGRPVDFLAPFFADTVELVGLYGLEWRRDGRTGRIPEAGRWRAVVADTVARARAELPGDVHIESKGLAVTLHYRTVPERRGTIEAWAATWASRTGLHVGAARCSVELNPPVLVDKGRVVSDAVSSPDVRHACYIGDDHADIAAFAALEASTENGLDTRRIAVHGTETPDELVAAADLVVDGPTGVVDLLVSLLGDQPAAVS
ncbi:MAG: trehalose-phosphatase [Actinobacteria bacterium]|nr:trehalose-phosphatase [Actinomycetota bacterium]